MITAELQEVARSIGRFYLSKNQGDRDAAQNDLEKLLISEIKLDNGTVIIHTARPGMLIGKRGQNIFALAKWLEDAGWPHIKIIESEWCWLDYLTSGIYDD